MKDKKKLNTRSQIVQCALKLFVEKGYSNAYVTTIANELNISTGNITFHFPTKEHVLVELVQEICAYLYEIEKKNQEKYSVPVAYFLEQAMFVSVCVENTNVKDFILAAYTHSMSLEAIRANDTRRTMDVFREFCPKWTEAEFIQAENIVSGIEYAMHRTENAERLSLEQRLVGSMDAIMKIYEVPEEARKSIIADVLAVDYYSEGLCAYREFLDYLEKIYSGDF